MTGIHPITRQRARKLRAEMTPQERKVWAKLRELNRMLGLNFRRQAPIGPFIADFAELGRRLVIEIDGGGHGGERDQRRDEWFASQGLQVLRFWNPEVSGNIEGVMQLVLDAVDGESLAGGGGHPARRKRSMKRLIQRGLMFGNLIEVSSPALVERYNRALKHLTGKTTTLDDFHIDLSGYSPEIGDELNDDLYLNPNGANRQFILLTTAQKDAPLLNIKFSTSRGILTQFIEKNEAQLFALTARDAVAGELQNSVYAFDTPAKLFDIRQVTVEADTIGGHVADAGKLAKLIERFRQEPDGWRDDVLVAEMIGLAKKTGDVTRVPISLPAMTFQQSNFWTSHFGGVYIFQGVRYPAAISTLDWQSLGEVPIAQVMDLTHRNQIADWLERNGLVEPIVQARGTDAAAILRQKMDFILVDAADRLGIEIGDARRTELRKVAYKLGTSLPEEFLGLAALLRWVEAGGPWPKITSEHPAYFYTLRGKGPEKDLVNMLLSELSPMDVRQMFIVHKELFYAQYATWSDRKKTYVADFLAREYQVDREGARTALFGPEPSMDELHRPQMAEGPKPSRPVVGPWGGRR